MPSQCFESVLKVLLFEVSFVEHRLVEMFVCFYFGFLVVCGELALVA
jgi:hypothetical protein